MLDLRVDMKSSAPKTDCEVTSLASRLQFRFYRDNNKFLVAGKCLAVGGAHDRALQVGAVNLRSVFLERVERLLRWEAILVLFAVRDYCNLRMHFGDKVICA